MDNAKYIGMDVHKETISIAVLNAAGKSVMGGWPTLPLLDPWRVRRIE